MLYTSTHTRVCLWTWAASCLVQLHTHCTQMLYSLTMLQCVRNTSEDSLIQKRSLPEHFKDSISEHTSGRGREVRHIRGGSERQVFAASSTTRATQIARTVETILPRTQQAWADKEHADLHRTTCPTASSEPRLALDHKSSQLPPLFKWRVSIPPARLEEGFISIPKRQGKQ